MSDEGVIEPRPRAWTRVLAAILITVQVVGAALIVLFIVAAAGCNIVFGTGNCEMTGIKVVESLAVLGISGGMLAWWIYALARLQRAGLIAALVCQALAVIAAAVAIAASGSLDRGSLAVWEFRPGFVTLLILVIDGGLRRRILTSATN